MIPLPESQQAALERAMLGEDAPASLNTPKVEMPDLSFLNMVELNDLAARFLDLHYEVRALILKRKISNMKATRK